MASPVPVAASVSANPPEATELTDAERLLARVDRAQLALALGKKEEARQLLNGVAEIAVDAPDVWRKYAVVLASSLSDPASKPTDLPLFEDAVMLKADESPAASHDGIWLDVNKTDFVLTVMNNGRPLRRFPVGLGKGNTTPSGDYRIANKLTNPDWYNRGETVPAGDPRNPLGKHWMGLGNERGVPTAYGIHSISQTSDLGQPVGRGCIRMIPSDAEALFRLCPIGTPVHIHP
jgi:lipoprotein-anchoring transpeptidase ErfK/SrfK